MFTTPECVAAEVSGRVGRSPVVSWARQVDVVGSGGSHLGAWAWIVFSQGVGAALEHGGRAIAGHWEVL